MFYVYILRSKKSGYRYIGQTNDLQRRLKEYDEGFTKSIRFQLPLVLEYVEVYKTRIEAIRREKFFKSGKGREWLEKNAKSKK